jgi:hypothetical protein
MKRVIVNGAAGAVLLALLVSQADAATIEACQKKNGTIRIVTKNERCKKNETRLSWNTSGTTGATGPTGPAGSNGTNGSNGSGSTSGSGVNGSNGATGMTGATGPTGPAGSNGTNGSNGSGSTSGSGVNGSNGATGPAGSNGANGSNGGGGPTDRVCATVGLSPNDVTTCRLKEKVAETGAWSASIAVPNGGPQQQANGVVSFNPKYPIEPATLTLHYRNEAESGSPTKPCLGSVNEPQAEQGNLCVYRGAQKGKETEDKNIKEPNAAGNTEGFGTLLGEHLENGKECPNEVGLCQTGVLVIFRTAQFAEPSVPVTAASYLNAFGSWAVTAN